MKANLSGKEPETLKWWKSLDIYGSVRTAHEGDPTYVLHDGPPYANGHIHVGHALNKILKDFVIKSRSMMGHDARYVPGWDCHGLPIEHRVDKELGPKKAGMDPLQVRRLCRKYALKFIEIQRGEFQRLGIFWDRRLDVDEENRNAPNRLAIYRTLDRTYEAEIVRQLGRFFEKDAVYHGVKPVHWCSSCKTALAEAEVEYQDRTDPSIYVKLPASGLEKRVPDLAGKRTSLVIWTTTPWTLPANLAVALHPDLVYVAVRVGDEHLIVADGLLPQVREKLGWADAPVEARFTGRELVGEGDDWLGDEAPVQRPYVANDGPASRAGAILLGDHVTLDAGTGCVHTAPGHGADDFIIGKRYGLEPFNPVDEDGTFKAGSIGQDWLHGVYVLKANAKIIDDLKSRDLLLLAEDYPHSYPHCWRCKNPVLFLSTPQWFISMDASGLREAAQQQITETRWLPATGEARLAKMVEGRPDWCISRQRTWGVPIPAVVCEPCSDEHDDAFLRQPEFFSHLEQLFLDEGSDAWFGVPDEKGHRPYASETERLHRLVPEGIACPRCEKREGLRIHEHIVDVWFESGVSHSAVLGRDSATPWPADLYLEGHDQYRGWFQSSLLVATNDREQAPFREVVTHGFTLDAAGRKMSKAVGNVISPLDVAKERGAEILRMWVAMIDFLEDMRLSEETLDRNAEAYRKIRNTFRYMLGNLNGFDPRTDQVSYAEMTEMDRWALQQLEAQRRRLIQAYSDHQYHAIYHGLHNFCNGDLSSFYFDVIKDRLYTYPAGHPHRRSAQTVLYRLARDLCRLMAPVLCFTAEEIWQQLQPFEGADPWTESSVHAQNFPEALELPADAELLKRWERLRLVRDEVYRSLELARADKRIGTGLEARVIIETEDAELVSFLGSFGDELRFLLITSQVVMGPAGETAVGSENIPGLKIGVERADGDKCERCWNFTTDVGASEAWPTICARCAAFVGEIVASTEPA